MSELLLTQGRVIDPASNRDETADVLIRNGRIAAIGAGAAGQAGDKARRLDVSGKVVSPGLIDIHVHFREPGQTAKETIASGSRAAAKGGFTSVVCMPNTSPPVDGPATVALIQDQAERESPINVYVTGAITLGIAGKMLAPIGSLKKAGVVAITDDGHCIQNNELMRRAVEYAKMFELPVMDHCQDYDLVSDGVLHEGYWSTNLGLSGWPAVGEEIIVARNILLAEMTGNPIHCQHMTSVGAVRLIREAKSRGVPITGEACPHHFLLTDAAIAGSGAFWAKDGEGVHFGEVDRSVLPEWPPYDTNFKMNPPLRSAADREAVIEGVVDGTLEIISSDHAPHCDYEKEREFDFAPFGITGLETELALSLMQFYHAGRLSLLEVLRRMTINPARLLKLDRGTLAEGEVADITVIDPDAEWVFKQDDTASLASNSPFYGWPLRGRAVAAIVAGEVVWSD